MVQIAVSVTVTVSVGVASVVFIGVTPAHEQALA
jgi:hypothetical protein